MMCMDRETAAAYLGGYLEPEESQRWAAHVAQCPTCEQLVQEVSELFDHVRQILVAGDIPFCSETPSPEEIRQNAHSAALGNQGLPMKVVTGKFRDAVQKIRLRPRWLTFSMRVGAFAAILVVISGAVYFISSRSVAHAQEILRRSELAAGKSQNIPGRVVHRVYKVLITNGYGPLPDGEYREEFWWDNVNLRSARVRYDSAGHLRDGNWQMPDGSYQAYVAFDESRPYVVMGPSDVAVREEIGRLPDGLREKVANRYSELRRPFYEVAANRAAQTVREITTLAASNATQSSVDEVTLPDGKKLYRVTLHIEKPEAIVPRWDVTRIIAGETYLKIEEHDTGYRRDGKIFETTRILAAEEVLLPGEEKVGIFEPGPFPKNVQVRRVSALERVQGLERLLGLRPQGAAEPEKAQ